MTTLREATMNDLLKFNNVNLDPLTWLGVSCSFGRVSFFAQLLFSTLAPLGVAALVGASYAARAALGGATWDPRREAIRHLHACLLLSYLVLPSVSATIFTTFLCDRDFGAGAPDRGFLVADYAVACDSEECGRARAPRARTS